MKSRGFFHTKIFCFSYVLFISNNGNNKIPLKLSVKVALILKNKLDEL